jgi:hypothetical protein
LRRSGFNMKKIVSIMLIGMMTVGCGKTARLERDRLEAAQEQARLAAEAKANRSTGNSLKITFVSIRTLLLVSPHLPCGLRLLLTVVLFYASKRRQGRHWRSGNTGKTW